jgi:outer membrane receptor for ferrienterochelin and colicin
LGAGPSSGLAEPEVPVEAEEELLFKDIASVYTASKYEQKITEAPSKVSIVTDDEIRRYGYRTLADILRSLPGFYVSYDRNYSYVGVRGFGVPGDYNTRVLMLVDGHRINDNIYDSTYNIKGSAGAVFLACCVVGCIVGFLTDFR